MKIFLLFVVISLAWQVHAANVYTCQVTQHVIKQVTCRVCKNLSDDRALCKSWADEPCLREVPVATNLKASESVTKALFSLTGRNEDSCFSFDRNVGGYSLWVSYQEKNALPQTASVTSMTPLDLNQDVINLALMTGESREVAGNVVEINVICKPE